MSRCAHLWVDHAEGTRCATCGTPQARDDEETAAWAERKLVSIEGGTDWPEGVPDALKGFLESALEDCDRVVIIGLRRTHDEGGAGCAVRAAADKRKHSKVSWLEMLGAIHKKLTDWTVDMEDDDV